jgi:hypothetical protein
MSEGIILTGTGKPSRKPAAAQAEAVAEELRLRAAHPLGAGDDLDASAEEP